MRLPTERCVKIPCCDRKKLRKQSLEVLDDLLTCKHIYYYLCLYLEVATNGADGRTSHRGKLSRLRGTGEELRPSTSSSPSSPSRPKTTHLNTLLAHANPGIFPGGLTAFASGPFCMQIQRRRSAFLPERLFVALSTRAFTKPPKTRGEEQWEVFAAFSPSVRGVVRLSPPCASSLFSVAGQVGRAK